MFHTLNPLTPRNRRCHITYFGTQKSQLDLWPALQGLIPISKQLVAQISFKRLLAKKASNYAMKTLFGLVAHACRG